MKNDSDTDKYYDNILKHFEYNDKLMHIPVDYTILSVGTNDNSIDNISLDEYYYMVKNSWDTLEIDIYAFEHMMLSSIISQSIDYENSICNFDNEKFKKVLDIIKTSREKYNYQVETGTYPDKKPDIKIFFPLVSEYSERIFEQNQNDYYFAGICSDMEVYSYIPYYTGVSISSKSLHKEEAWNFIKNYLLDNYDKTSNPEQYIKSTISAYNKELELKGEEPLIYEPDNFKNLYEFCKKPSCVNLTQTSVYTIMQDEIEPYFNGHISADEAIANAHKMINRYLDEK